MPTHFWGDEDFDWDNLYQAEIWIKRWCRWLSALNISTKEKYGTIRYELKFSWGFKENRLLRLYQDFIFKLVTTLVAYRYWKIREEIIVDLLDDYVGVPWFWKLIVKENPWKRQ